MQTQTKDPLYSGKAKSVYATEHPDQFMMEFRDDVSAFNGVKTAKLSRKGEINNQFNAFFMEKLEAAGIKTHHIETLSANTSLVKKLEMLPVECVVRNWAAGSICKRLGLSKGQMLEPPVFEFFLKDDDLGDPMINDSHIATFGWATASQVDEMKRLTLAINGILQPSFKAAGLWLVDYKLEFGVYEGELVLGDEFTPDGCRIWDSETKEPFDKDRFRQDLGDVVASYEEVARKLGVPL